MNKLKKIISSIATFVLLITLSVPVTAAVVSKTKDTITLGGSVLWNDKENLNEQRPDEVKVFLFENGIEVGNTTTNALMDWKFSFDVKDNNASSPEYTIAIASVENYEEEINLHKNPSVNIQYNLGNSWTKYEPNNKLAIPSAQLNSSIIIGKMTSHHPIIVWSPNPLSSTEQSMVLESILGQPGVGNPSGAIYISGDGASESGMTVLSSEGMVIFERTSDWALIYGGDYASAQIHVADGQIVLKAVEPEPPMEPEQPTEPEQPSQPARPSAPNYSMELDHQPQTGGIVSEDSLEDMQYLNMSSSKDQIKNLIKENEDMKAWIQIEGTRINYPVMTHKGEEDYYLYRDVYGNESVYGTPYFRNMVNMGSKNILIYGHNMDDGSMFADLLKYEDYEFYKNHPTITLETEKESAEYKIIAVFREEIHYKNETDVFRYYDYAGKLTKAKYKEYVKQIKKRSLYEIEENEYNGEQLLTLSTCSYHAENGRFVVVAVKR